MKIVRVETFLVGAGWKNWLFVRVVTDEGLWGIGEATLNGFGRTCEAAVHELGDLAVGSDPRQVRSVVGQLYDRVSNEGGPRTSDGHGRHRGGLLGHPGQVARRPCLPAVRRTGARQCRLLRQRVVPLGTLARSLRPGRRRGGEQGVPGAQVRPLGYVKGLFCSQGKPPVPATSSLPSGLPSGQTCAS